MSRQDDSPVRRSGRVASARSSETRAESIHESAVLEKLGAQIGVAFGAGMAIMKCRTQKSEKEMAIKPTNESGATVFQPVLRHRMFVARGRLHRSEEHT